MLLGLYLEKSIGSTHILLSPHMFFTHCLSHKITYLVFCNLMAYSLNKYAVSPLHPSQPYPVPTERPLATSIPCTEYSNDCLPATTPQANTLKAMLKWFSDLHETTYNHNLQQRRIPSIRSRNDPDFNSSKATNYAGSGKGRSFIVQVSLQNKGAVGDRNSWHYF